MFRQEHTTNKTMQSLDVNKAANAWSSLAGAVFRAHTNEEYRRLVTLLDSLIDEVRGRVSPARLADGNRWSVN